MVVLKRVDDARRDGDQILAVIAGSAVNHDGRSNGLIAPNQDAQADVLRRAYKDAGIDPRTVDYIEAHGTGTVLGDPIEAEALGRVVGRGRPADRPALLGAVKTNVGHMESAAGAASMAKVVLALQHDKLPPSINFAGPSPYIDFDAHAPEGHRHRDRLAALRRLRAGRGVELRLRRGQRAHGGARGLAARRDRARAGTRARGSSRLAAEAPPKRPRWKATRCGSTNSARSSPTQPRPTEEEPELPGLTEEALRLKEVALEELAAQEASSRQAADPARGVGVLDLTQEGRGRRAGGLDGKPRGAGVVAGVDRPVAVAAQPRPLARGGAGPRPRGGHQGSARGRRGQAAAERVQRRRAGDQRPGVGDGRIRRAAPQDGQEPVPAQRGLRRVDREGRRAGPGRAGLLGARADPGRLAGLRHRNQPGHHLRDPDRAG